MIFDNHTDGLIDRLKKSRETDACYFLAFYFVLTFSYFHWFGGYLLFFQEQQSLFVFSPLCYHDYLVKPGGLLDLSGKFLTQFYINNIQGSVILAAVLTLPGIILIHINRRLKPAAILAQLLLLMPPLLLLLMQTHYYHMMVYNLGFLLILLYFLFSIFSGKKIIRYLFLVLYPLFYYLAGAYALIFLCLYILYNLSYEKGAQKFSYSLMLLAVAAVSFIISKEILFLQPVSQLLLFPLPFVNDPNQKVLFYFLTGYIILYPLLCRIAGSVKPDRVNIRLIALVLVLIIFSSTVLLLNKMYNRQTAWVINLEKLVFEENWNKAIEYQIKYPSGNRIGQYFYNIALSETDQLCDRLFCGRQDFGAGSLFLPWSNEHLPWGAWVFYSTGLINEAMRWADEETVVYGYRPENIKMLVKTNLINGNYRMAGKYISILKNTLYYKKWAKEYQKLVGDSLAIKSHPELGKKVRILPRDDFFIYLESPEDNLVMLIKSNSDNRKAFEYYLAGLLLTKNVESAVNNIKKMKEMGYTRIPRHIEEAALIYYNSTRVFPDLGGLTISSETRARFDQYFAAYINGRNNPSLLKEKMQEKFGNTFWFYFHFK